MADARSRTRLRPIIRVFVSSTFSDLKPERDEPARRMFRKLEQLSLKGESHFQAIDLTRMMERDRHQHRR